MNATELKSQLECPICFTIPSCNVLVCINGHRICLKCFSSLGVKQCPQSRCIFDDPPRRNRDLESIIERGDWVRACPWPGCPAELEKKDLLAHQENCERHPGRSKDAVCPFTECQKLLAIGDLDNHLSRSHHEFYVTSATSKYQIKISKTAIESSNYDRKKLLFWKCPESGYVFYPQLVQRNNVWHFWVAVKAGPHLAKQFRSNVTVSLEGKTPGRTSLVWQIKAAGQLVQPVTSSVRDSLRHSVIIYRETFQLALRNNKNSLQVKIQFKIVKEKC